LAPSEADGLPEANPKRTRPAARFLAASPAFWQSRRSPRSTHENKKITMAGRKAHRAGRARRQEQDLVEWAKFNREVLAQHDICATGTTGAMMEDVLDLPIRN